MRISTLLEKGYKLFVTEYGCFIQGCLTIEIAQ